MSTSQIAWLIMAPVLGAIAAFATRARFPTLRGTPFMLACAFTVVLFTAFSLCWMASGEFINAADAHRQPAEYTHLAGGALILSGLSFVGLAASLAWNATRKP